MRELGIIDDGAVLVEDGVIRDVGPSRRVENLAAAREADEISADGRVVMPGFVDSRVYVVSGPPLLDEYEQRVSGPFQEGFDGDELPEPAPAKALSSSSRPLLEMLAGKAVREFVRHGTTTIEARARDGLDDRTILKVLRAMRTVQRRPLDLEPTFFLGGGPESARAEADPGYLERLTTHSLAKIRRLGLARFVDVRVGRGGHTPEWALEYLRAAQARGFLTRVTTTGSGPAGGAAWAAAAGAVSVSGLEYAGELTTRRLADSATVAVLTPGVSYHRMRSSYPPARLLIDNGVAVALATGFASHGCPSCSLPVILSLACTQMRMTPAESVVAATINGAFALGRAERAGSIEPGKDADLIMLNASDYREIPYRFGMNLVAMVMKRGDIIYPRMDFARPTKSS